MSHSQHFIPPLVVHKQSSFVPIIPIPQNKFPLQSGFTLAKPPPKYPYDLNQNYEKYLKMFREHRLLKTQLNRVMEEKREL